MKLHKIQKIVILGLLIYIIFVFYYICKKEHYVTFLNPKESCKVIKENPSYFHLMSENDKQARQLTINYKNQPLAHYCSNFVNFTQNEKNILKSLITKIQKNLLPSKHKFIKEYATNWNISKISPSIEYGFPHTHQNTIFLSENAIHNDPRKVIITLLHEQVHILQRKYPQWFLNLYVNYWNFIKIKLDPESKAHIKKYHRNNPDGMDFEWAMKTSNGPVILLAKYRNNNPSNLSVIEYVYCPLQKNGTLYSLKNPVTWEQILALDDFNEFYGITSNYYHPNEISAEIISYYFAEKMGLEYPYKKTRSYFKIDKWLHSIH